jgi:hypothetical protein
MLCRTRGRARAERGRPAPSSLEGRSKGGQRVEVQGKGRRDSAPGGTTRRGRGRALSVRRWPGARPLQRRRPWLPRRARRRRQQPSSRPLLARQLDLAPVAAWAREGRLPSEEEPLSLFAHGGLLGVDLGSSRTFDGRRNKGASAAALTPCGDAQLDRRPTPSGSLLAKTELAYCFGKRGKVMASSGVGREDLLSEHLNLGLVDILAAGRRRRARVAAGVEGRPVGVVLRVLEDGVQPWLDVRPRAGVEGLLLAPLDVGVGEAVDVGRDEVVREGRDLLDTGKDDVLDAAVLTLLQQGLVAIG